MPSRNATQPLGIPGVVDPRGVALRAEVAPAARLGSLDGRRLLLVDNKKLGPDFGPYGVIWDVLRAKIPAAAWSMMSTDLHSQVDPTCETLAAELIEREGPDGVVLALAEAGVSLPTAMLALAFEGRGVPTVILGTESGSRFVSGLFEVLAPRLRPIEMPTARTDSEQRVVEMIEERLGAIVQALTQDPSEIEERADAASARRTDTTDWAALGNGMLRFQDLAEAAAMGDGLPLIPPSEGAVAAMLATVPYDPHHVVFGPAVTSGRSLRVIDVAASAVMTACPARAFPVVLTALRAMARPEYRLNLGAITTHASGNAVVFSGPDAAAYGLASGAGCLGPGHRANASVGRAVSLSVLNLFGARPGAADMTAFGSPAEFTYCLAEDTHESPWPSLARERGDGASGVLVMKAEGPRNILEHLATEPAELLEALAGVAVSLGSNNTVFTGDLLVILNPEHAELFADAGWTREDLKHALFERARIGRARVEGHGTRPVRPRWFSVCDDIPVTRTPDDIHIVVAGSRGPQSMMALPWGLSRAQWEPVRRR